MFSTTFDVLSIVDSSSEKVWSYDVVTFRLLRTVSTLPCRYPTSAMPPNRLELARPCQDAKGGEKFGVSTE